MLLTAGADVNKQTRESGNALYGAAAKGSTAALRALLNHKAKVNDQGGHDRNALQAAAYGGYHAIVQLLLDGDANIISHDNQGRYPIQLAIRGNHDTLIDFVLAKIGIPDWNYQNQQGCSALYFAASSGSDRIVQVILKSDVDVDLLDTSGWMPLHWACRSGSRRTKMSNVRYLDNRSKELSVYIHALGETIWLIV